MTQSFSVLLHWRERSCGVRQTFCMYLLLALLTVVLAAVTGVSDPEHMEWMEKGKVSQIDRIRFASGHIDNIGGRKL